MWIILVSTYPRQRGFLKLLLLYNLYLSNGDVLVLKGKTWKLNVRKSNSIAILSSWYSLVKIRHNWIPALMSLYSHVLAWASQQLYLYHWRHVQEKEDIYALLKHNNTVKGWWCLKLLFVWSQQGENLLSKCVTNKFTSTWFQEIFNVFFPVEAKTIISNWI